MSDYWEELIAEAKRNLVDADKCDTNAAEIARLRAALAEAQAVVEKIKTPDFYWDDRNLDYAIEPGEVGVYDDVGDIIELRPIHELPAVWALVTEEGPVFFDTQQAAESARGGKEKR